MKRHSVVAAFAIICIFFLFAGTSTADSFTLDYYDTATGGKQVDVVATLSATNDGGGVYTITGITGTYNGVAITGLAPLSTYGTNYNFDNLLYYPASSETPYFDWLGLAFYIPGDEINLCGTYGCDNTNVPYTSLSGFGNVGTDVTVNVTTTPEPGSLVLMGTGLIGLAGALRRKLIG